MSIRFMLFHSLPQLHFPDIQLTLLDPEALDRTVKGQHDHSDNEQGQYVIQRVYTHGHHILWPVMYSSSLYPTIFHYELPISFQPVSLCSCGRE